MRQTCPRPTAPVPPAGTPPARAWGVRLMAWLMALQLLVPTLGLMHEVLHGLSPSPPATAAALQIASAAATADPALLDNAPSAAAEGQADHRMSSWHGLFDDHGAQDCPLYDQMASALALVTWERPITALPPNTHQAAQLHARLLRQSPALYDARAPPPPSLG